ncbi:MAG: HAMP domain-containing sensor histidine kinase [Peptococcaceae bacterium]
MLPIRWRLILSYTGVLIFTLILFGAFLYSAVQRNLLRQTDRTLVARAQEIASKIRTPQMLGWRGGLMLPRMSAFASPGTYFQIVSDTGEVMAKSVNLGSDSLPVSLETIEQARQKGSFFQTVGPKNEELRVYNLPINVKNRLIGLLQVGYSLELINNMLKRLAQTLFIVSLITIGLAVGLGYYLALTALSPINRLTRAVAAVSETQDLNKQVEYQGPPDEIGKLTSAFNKMLARLAAAQRSLSEAYTAQRRFVADVSHELRTPLTIIRGNLEFLQQIEKNNQMQAEVLADAAGEAERMSRLLNNLLILARADAGQHIEKEPLDLGALVQDIARQAPLLGSGAFFFQNLEILSGARIMGNADYLKQLLLILLDNAFKYSSPTGKITLAATQKEGWFSVIVSDTGPGIPFEELPRIFERFFRGTTGHTGGTGLGLAIARWIAEEHGGHLEVISRPDQGSTFTLRLPAFLN